MTSDATTGHGTSLRGGLRARLLAGIPVIERRVRAAGVTTTVLEGGEGSPLILLHGGIQSGGLVWTRVLPRLAQTNRLIVPDQPGLGESQPVARLNQLSFNDWLNEVLALFAPEKPMLLAHSLTGTFAARYAAASPGRLGVLVICAAPGLGAYRMPVGLSLAAIRSSVRPTLGNHERFQEWAFFDVDRTERRAPEWFEAFKAYTVSLGDAARQADDEAHGADRHEAGPRHRASAHRCAH